MTEWFSDEDQGRDIVEEIVEGRPRLFVRWRDYEKNDHSVEFPDYEYKKFAVQVANDIESNYFGFASFMTRCDGPGLHDAATRLKNGVDKLRRLLETKCEPMHP